MIVLFRYMHLRVNGEQRFWNPSLYRTWKFIQFRVYNKMVRAWLRLLVPLFLQQWRQTFAGDEVLGVRAAQLGPHQAPNREYSPYSNRILPRVLGINEGHWPIDESLHWNFVGWHC
jgi:hypothetical protein